MDHLRSLESKFIRAFEEAQEDLRDAERSLRSCEQDTYEDEDGNIVYPDCSFEETHVRDCRQMLDYQIHRLQTYKAQIKNIQKSISEYQTPKLKYRSVIQFEKEAGTSSLQQLINGAEDYLSVTNTVPDNGMNGFGLTETVAKMDPTMVLAATVGVAEIMIMTIFSFFGVSGRSLTISNSRENEFVTSSISGDGAKQLCSKLKIERKSDGNYSRIISLNIPPELQNEKIGRTLLQNLESTSRANDCKEISGWSNKENLGFFTGMGYQVRNEVKDSGAEVFKPLESNFLLSQSNAKSAFQNVDAMDFKRNIGKKEVNPLNIISPDEINDENFWKQHDRDGMERYIDQIEKYDKCRELLKDGRTIEEIKKSDFNSAIAYENFISKSDTIRLHKNGDYFKIDGGGRHRVAAAQIYFLRTGKVIPIEAEITEKD